MWSRKYFGAKQSSMGQSLIELAVILPVVLILLLGVADLSRAILFNNILINMSREGSNLASRTSQSPQFIIKALNDTSAPLQMASHGMVYVARVTGVDDGHGVVVARIDDQYRSTSGNGDQSLGSKLWSCPSWDATTGRCNMPSVSADRVVVLPLALARNAEVHVVETIYRYSPMTTYLFQTASDLYSFALL